MTPMDHAAAHERLEDLLLEPASLADLESSTAQADVALLEHVGGCEACRADLDTWRNLQRSIAEALPATDAAAAAATVEPIELPPSLRAATVEAIRPAWTEAAVRQLGLGGGAQARGRPSQLGRPRLATWLGLAASIVLLAGVGLVSVDQATRRAAAEVDARALTSALAAVGRVLAEPDHRAVALRTASGAAAGSISWSSHDLVVLTTALAAPAAGQRYRCWLEDNGRSVAIGQMYFAGGTAYWIGSLDEWATFQIGPATRFVVTLEPVAAQDRTGPAVLSADLGA
jgi:hypothetical protein